MTDTQDDPLFESATVNDLRFENRVGLAPMTRVSATADGRATERMARYYEKFAEGGFGHLITEGVYTDETYSQGYHNQPGLATDEQVESWRPVTEAVHDAGAPIVAQLMHAGAQTQGNPHVEETLGPSETKPKGEMAEAYGGSGEFPTSRAATREELEAARDGFVAAAENAREAGFDGVEIHAANGYFLNEFLAANDNDRDDEFGGDPESRARYPASVVEAVVEAVPDDFVVGVRVSQAKVSDPEYVWEEAEAAAEAFFAAFSEADPDYVHVTEPDITAPAFGDEGPTLTEYAATHVDAPVVANGGLGDPSAAREALRDGADFVTLGTGALANHDWPARVEEGRELASFDPGRFLAPTAEVGDHEVLEPVSGDD